MTEASEAIQNDLDHLVGNGWVTFECINEGISPWQFFATFGGWLSDPFYMVEWPPTRGSRGWKGHFESPGLQKLPNIYHFIILKLKIMQNNFHEIRHLPSGFPVFKTHPLPFFFERYFWGSTRPVHHQWALSVNPRQCCNQRHQKRYDERWSFITIDSLDPLFQNMMFVWSEHLVREGKIYVIGKIVVPLNMVPLIINPII